MSSIDDWPQAQILATLPATARLRPTFDPGRLLADLRKVRGENWAQPRIVDGNGVGSYATKLDWRSLPLRSIGGSADRTDPGGPDLAEFADTPLRARVPYLSEVLSAIPAPLRCARLMALGPGAESPAHLDTKCGLPWGNVRLHVPIFTTQGAVLEIDGGAHCWQPGELWYADFTRMHVVRNTDPSVTRIHFVIDCRPTRELLDLFPDEFRRPDVVDQTLLASDAAILAGSELETLRCRFAMPASFRSFEEANGEFVGEQQLVPAAIERYGDGLAMYADGRPSLALVHVGNQEFRFAGWTSERTLQISHGGKSGLWVTLRSRVGSKVHEARIPASPLS